MRDFKDPTYRAWRKQVYVRDKYKCQMPGCPSKGKLEAHHIERWADNPRLRFDINNGITLCKKCHNFIKNRERFYENLFKSIIIKVSGGQMSEAMMKIIMKEGECSG